MFIDAINENEAYQKLCLILQTEFRLYNKKFSGLEIIDDLVDKYEEKYDKQFYFLRFISILDCEFECSISTIKLREYRNCDILRLIEIINQSQNNGSISMYEKKVAKVSTKKKPKKSGPSIELYRVSMTLKENHGPFYIRDDLSLTDVFEDAKLFTSASVNRFLDSKNNIMMGPPRNLLHEKILDIINNNEEKVNDIFFDLFSLQHSIKLKVPYKEIRKMQTAAKKADEEKASKLNITSKLNEHDIAFLRSKGIDLDSL